MARRASSALVESSWGARDASEASTPGLCDRVVAGEAAGVREQRPDLLGTRRRGQQS